MSQQLTVAVFIQARNNTTLLNWVTRLVTAPNYNARQEKTQHSNSEHLSQLTSLPVSAVWRLVIKNV